MYVHDVLYLWLNMSVYCFLDWSNTKKFIIKAVNLKIYSIKSRGGAFFHYSNKRGLLAIFPTIRVLRLPAKQWRMQSETFDEGPQRLSKLTHKLYHYSGETTKWWVVILPTGSSDCSVLDNCTINQSVNKSIMESYIFKKEISFISDLLAYALSECSLQPSRVQYLCFATLVLWLKPHWSTWWA